MENWLAWSVLALVPALLLAWLAGPVCWRYLEGRASKGRQRKRRRDNGILRDMLMRRRDRRP